MAVIVAAALGAGVGVAATLGVGGKPDSSAPPATPITQSPAPDLPSDEDGGKANDVRVKEKRSVEESVSQEKLAASVEAGRKALAESEGKTSAPETRDALSDALAGAATLSEQRSMLELLDVAPPGDWAQRNLAAAQAIDEAVEAVEADVAATTEAQRASSEEAAKRKISDEQKAKAKARAAEAAEAAARAEQIANPELVCAASAPNEVFRDVAEAQKLGDAINEARASRGLPSLVVMTNDAVVEQAGDMAGVGGLWIGKSQLVGCSAGVLPMVNAWLDDATNTKELVREDVTKMSVAVFRGDRNLYASVQFE